MRRVLTILCFFLALASEGQYVKAVLTSGTGYPTNAGNADNIKMTYGFHIPPANPNGRLHPVVIYLHGIDHKGEYVDTTSTSGIDRVFLKGTPLQVKTKPLPYFLPPAMTGASNLYRFAVFAPMLYKGFGTWHVAYGIEMIKLIKTNFANVCDTNRIYFVGFSLGGGGVLTFAGNKFINENTAAFFSIAPGYNSATNYQNQTDWNTRLFVYHCRWDKLAPVSVSDNIVYNLNIRRSLSPVQYKCIQDSIGGVNFHDIWPQILDTIPGDTYRMTNGDTWVNAEVIYRTMLRFAKQRYIRTALVRPVLLNELLALRRDAKVKPMVKEGYGHYMSGLYYECVLPENKIRINRSKQTIAC